MALPSTLWAAAAAAGAKDGSSLANAAGIDAGAANDIWTIVNADAPAAGGTTVRLCADSPVTVSGGATVTRDGTNANRFTLQGRTAADDADAEVALDANGGAFPVLTLATADYWLVNDFRATNTNQAAGNSGVVVSVDADNLGFARCRADNCYQGFALASASTFNWLRACRADNNASTGFVLNLYCRANYCVAHENGGHGFDGGDLSRCLAYTNVGTGLIVSTLGVGLVAYDNGLGFTCLSTGPVLLEDCVATGNATYGYSCALTTHHLTLSRCASYSNTSGRSLATGKLVDSEAIVLTANPFIDAANGNFALNMVAGGGRMLRNKTLLFPGGMTTGYQAPGVAEPAHLYDALGGLL